jgi:dephospho-CoA kinase
MAAPEVTVVDYDPEWPARGAALVEELTSTLAVPARRIDHIGSTSIPGMAAKDVLDIQVSVDELDLAAAALDEPLRSLGFEQGPYGHDHVPAGSSDDPELWRKRYWSRRGSAHGDVNLHVRTVGSPNERLALLFRDWFRAHPSAIPAYAAFKRALADAVPDSGVYSEVKDPVVDLVITIAETWAKHTSWTP